MAREAGEVVDCRVLWPDAPSGICTGHRESASRQLTIEKRAFHE
jgi:hypothetical protein